KMVIDQESQHPYQLAVFLSDQNGIPLCEVFGQFAHLLGIVAQMRFVGAFPQEPLAHLHESSDVSFLGFADHACSFCFPISPSNAAAAFSAFSCCAAQNSRAAERLAASLFASPATSAATAWSWSV